MGTKKGQTLKKQKKHTERGWDLVGVFTLVKDSYYIAQRLSEFFLKEEELAGLGKRSLCSSLPAGESYDC